MKNLTPSKVYEDAKLHSSRKALKINMNTNRGQNTKLNQNRHFPALTQVSIQLNPNKNITQRKNEEIETKR